MLKMKIVITIILAFLSGRLLSQTPFPVNSTNGTSTTTNLTRGIAAADSAFQYRTYFLDTASANRGRIDEVPGVVIRTAPNVIWLRNSTATAWIRQANINDIINITGCYALLNGGLVSWSGSGLTMDVSAADYLINCKEYSTITSQVTLSTADATYDRFDIIYVDTNSTVGVITGTASATPIFPQIDPASQLQLAVISVPAGATTPGDVSSIVIYNEDIEWTSGSIMSSGTVDFVSTNNPFIGTYNALMSANANGVIYWDTANPININDYTTLKMYVRIDGGFDNDLAAYLVYLRSGGNPITNPIYLTDYGLDLSISGSYQIVTIPITAFTFAGSSSGVFDGIQLKFNNGSAALHIDYVQLQGGIPNGNSPYITNIFRVPGVDSIYFTKNGINYAIKDSIGSGGGSSYTFPYSVVAPGSAIQLENDTTANPANYFYGRNSAGRRGWYPQSGITGVNLFNSDGTFTGSRTVQADGNDFFILNAGDIDMSSNSRVLLEADNAQLLVSDSIEIKPHLGKLKIDSLNSTTDTTGKSLVIRNLTTGLLENIAPALLGGGGTPISSLTAATGTNNIDNTTYGQTWKWNTLGVGPGLFLETSGTTALNGQTLLWLSSSGLNTANGVTSKSAYIVNAKQGGSSTNYGIDLSSANATTNIGLRVSTSGGTNNYAIIVPPSSGNVGIGTSTPAASALVDITSTTQGVRFPTLNTTQQNAISSPATGLIIWNTDSLALVNYTGSAWLKVSQGGGGITNADNGLVKNSSGVVGLDSAGVNPLTRDVQINANSNQFIIDGATNLELSGVNSYIYGDTQAELRTPHSFIRVKSDSILIEPYLGKLKIDSLNYTLSTTGKKIMIRDTATGLVQNIDPALIGGGITVGTTTITSGTNGRIGYNNSGVYGEKAVTGTGDVVLATSPTLVTPDLGTPSALVGTNISGTISTRWKARVGSTTSSATPTINTDNVDIYKLTAQTADITSFTTNLTGTPNDGDVLEIQITGTAARAITWGASFVSSTVTLPLTTVTTATLTVILQYYTTSSYGNNKWVCVNYY